MYKYVLPVVLVFSVHTSSFAGDVYRWISDSGSVSYVDDIKKVPTYYKDRAVKVEFGPLKDYPRLTIVVASKEKTPTSCGNDAR